MTAKKTLIQVEAVSKTYKRGHETITALHSATLAINRGELLAIVGPSGAGKTTLTHIIGGLITPDTGNVTIDGKPLSTQSDKALSAYRNRTVGFIFQNFSLLPHYTALENVAMPLAVAGVPFRKRASIAKRYLTLVGLEKQANQRANELSGGERQRVSIARALVNEPSIIIADEPTGSLDSRRGQEIMTILETLSHQRNLAVLMVTHDPSLAARADRIIHISDGEIKREQRHA